MKLVVDTDTAGDINYSVRMNGTTILPFSIPRSINIAEYNKASSHASKILQLLTIVSGDAAYKLWHVLVTCQQVSRAKFVMTTGYRIFVGTKS